MMAAAESMDWFIENRPIVTNCIHLNLDTRQKGAKRHKTPA